MEVEDFGPPPSAALLIPHVRPVHTWHRRERCTWDRVRAALQRKEDGDADREESLEQ